MPPKKPVIKEDGTADFGALESVVSSQLAADAKYDRENDAKFRAVHQKVATYEEFENIVLGAHLQPMKEDITNLDLKKTTKSTTGRAREREREKMKHVSSAGGDELTSGPSADAPPKTAQEFARQWRALKGDFKSRYRYLLLTGGERLGTFYQSGADAILGEVLLSLSAAFEPDDSARVVKLLDSLSGTNRFSLAVEFLSADERKAGIDVLSRLTDGTTHDESDDDHDDHTGVGDDKDKGDAGSSAASLMNAANAVGADHRDGDDVESSMAASSHCVVNPDIVAKLKALFSS